MQKTQFCNKDITLYYLGGLTVINTILASEKGKEESQSQRVEDTMLLAQKMEMNAGNL
jgi:hypothetical protein